MKAVITPIGNSKGIRIPKALLEQCHIKKVVKIEVKGRSIIIKPFNQEPRKNWEQAFRKMHKNNDDKLLIEDNIDLNMENEEWE